jgi:hypothetical protein
MDEYPCDMAWSYDNNAPLAQAILNSLNEDPGFFTKGRRNNDAVDFCICCYVLNLDWQDEFVKARERRGFIQVTEGDVFRDFCDRSSVIANYLDEWRRSRGVMNYFIGDYKEIIENLKNQEVIELEERS